LVGGKFKSTITKINIMKMFQKAKNFLIDPNSAFDKEKKTKMSEAFKYTLILSLVTSIISAIISLSFNFILVIQGFFATYLGILFLNIIWWLWLHLISYTFGARKGIEQTFKIVFYGNTPLYLFSWVCLGTSFNYFLGVLGLILLTVVIIWSTLNQYLGLKKLHKISTSRAIAIIMVSLILPIIFLLIGGSLYFSPESVS